MQSIIASKQAGLRRILYALIKEGIQVELGDCEYKDGLLYVRKKIFVPFDEELRAELIRRNHNLIASGHGGKHATFARVARYYYWPRITDTVARYVKNCHVCARAKPHKEGKHGLLNPLPIADRYWISISIDFITPLPECTFMGVTYRHIMVVVDRLSKKKKFIPLTGLSVKEVVDAFIVFVWREEGYPVDIISDRGTQFVSHFWARLCTRIGTKPRLSTSHHPETDGQTEIANAALKAYLRAYVHYDQKDWVQFLPFAEFQANSDASQSTGMSAFEATKGYLPRSGTEPAGEYPADASWKAQRDTKAADALVARIQKLQEFLKDHLVWAQARMEKHANAHRQPAPAFREGDWVFLDARNIKTRRASQGLDNKNLGPYQIKRCCGNKAYELDLHGDLKGLFPVFHPWLLHLDERRPLAGQRQKPQGPVQVDEEGFEHHEVEDVLDSKIDKRCVDPQTGKRGGLLSYLVKWTGHEEPTWEPYHNLVNCSEAVRDYHRRDSTKPGPHKTFRYRQAHSETIAAMFLSGQAGTYGHQISS